MQLLSWGSDSTSPTLEDSNREVDDNNFLFIDNCVLTAEEVSEYLGREIDKSGTLGLTPDQRYGVYRPAEEIIKALDTYNNLTVTDGHVQITPEKPARERWIGNTGCEARFENGKLYNSVKISVKKAQDEIKMADLGKGGKKDLSCGYLYDLVPEEGNFNGKRYQFKMINLKLNHLALVPDGRVEPAMIADEIIKENKQVKKTLTQTILGFFIGDSKPGKSYLHDQAVAIDESDGDVVEKYKTLLELVLLQSGKGHIFDAHCDLENPTERAERAKMSSLDEKDDEDDKDKKADDAEMEEKEEEKKEIKDKKARDKKAKDESEEKEESKEEKEKAMDAAIQEHIQARSKVINLATKAMGKLSDQFLADASIETIVDTVLTKHNKTINGRSIETKLGMLEMLADAKIAARPKLVIGDSNTTYNSILPKRKGE